jgi:hypothetical protein
MNKTDKLSLLYKKASSLNEDLPKELMDKLSIYGQILELIGGLHAEAIQAWKLAEAKRREVIASAMVYGAELAADDGEPIQIKTAKEKEAAAEVIGAHTRREEATTEYEATRWKNAYNSTNEQINIMKKRYDHLVNVFSKGGI